MPIGGIAGIKFEKTRMSAKCFTLCMIVILIGHTHHSGSSGRCVADVLRKCTTSPGPWAAVSIVLEILTVLPKVA